MAISNEIIELTPVKKTKGLVIILASAMAVFLGAAVAFMVLFLTTDKVAPPPKVESIGAVSSMFPVSNEPGVFMATPNKQYYIDFKVNYTEGANTNIGWTCLPQNAVSGVTVRVLTTAEDGEDFQPDTYRISFTVQDIQSDSKIIFTAYSTQDASVKSEVQFYAKNMGTHELIFDRVEATGNKPLEITGEANPAFNIPFYSLSASRNKTYYMYFDQLGEYNAEFDTYARISDFPSTVADAPAGAKTNTLSVTSSKPDVISATVDVGLNCIRLEGKGLGEAVITVKANQYNDFGDRNIEYKIKANVLAPDSNVFNAMSEFYVISPDKKVPVTTDNWASFSPTDRIKDITMFVGDSLNLEQYFVISPKRLQFNENGNRNLSWRSSDKFSFTSSKAAVVTANQQATTIEGWSGQAFTLTANAPGTAVIELKDISEYSNDVFNKITVNVIAPIGAISVTGGSTVSIVAGGSADVTLNFTTMGLDSESVKALGDYVNSNIIVTATPKQSEEEYLENLSIKSGTLSVPIGTLTFVPVTQSTPFNIVTARLTISLKVFDALQVGDTIEISITKPQGIVHTRASDVASTVKFNLSVTATASGMRLMTDQEARDMLKSKLGADDNAVVFTKDAQNPNSATLTINQAAINTQVTAFTLGSFIKAVPDQATLTLTFTAIGVEKAINVGRNDGIITFKTIDDKNFITSYNIKAANITTELIINVKVVDVVEQLIIDDSNLNTQISYGKSGGAIDISPSSLAVTADNRFGTNTSNYHDFEIELTLGDKLLSTSKSGNVVSYKYPDKDETLFTYNSALGLSSRKLTIAQDIYAFATKYSIADIDALSMTLYKSMAYNDVRSQTLVFSLTRVVDEIRIYSDPSFTNPINSITVDHNISSTIYIASVIKTENNDLIASDYSNLQLSIQSLGAASFSKPEYVTSSTMSLPSFQFTAVTADGEQETDFDIYISTDNASVTKALAVRVQNRILPITGISLFRDALRAQEISAPEQMLLGSFYDGSDLKETTALTIYYTVTYLAGGSGYTRYEPVAVDLGQNSAKLTLSGTGVQDLGGGKYLVDIGTIGATPEATRIGQLIFLLNPSQSPVSGAETFVHIASNNGLVSNDNISFKLLTGVNSAVISYGAVDYLANTVNAVPVTLSITGSGQTPSASFTLNLTPCTYISTGQSLSIDTSRISITESNVSTGLQVTAKAQGANGIKISANGRVDNGSITITVTDATNPAHPNAFVFTIPVNVTVSVFEVGLSESSYSVQTTGAAGTQYQTVNLNSVLNGGNPSLQPNSPNVTYHLTDAVGAEKTFTGISITGNTLSVLNTLTTLSNCYVQARNGDIKSAVVPLVLTTTIVGIEWANGKTNGGSTDYTALNQTLDFAANVYYIDHGDLNPQPTVSYSLSAGAPAGINTSGLITFNPTVNGSGSFTVTASYTGSNGQVSVTHTINYYNLATDITLASGLDSRYMAPTWQMDLSTAGLIGFTTLTGGTAAYTDWTAAITAGAENATLSGKILTIRSTATGGAVKVTVTLVNGTFGTKTKDITFNVFRTSADNTEKLTVNIVENQSGVSTPKPIEDTQGYTSTVTIKDLPTVANVTFTNNTTNVSVVVADAYVFSGTPIYSYNIEYKVTASGFSGLSGSYTFTKSAQIELAWSYTPEVEIYKVNGAGGVLVNPAVENCTTNDDYYIVIPNHYNKGTYKITASNNIAIFSNGTGEISVTDCTDSELVVPFEAQTGGKVRFAIQYTRYDKSSSVNTDEYLFVGSNALSATLKTEGSEIGKVSGEYTLDVGYGTAGSPVVVDFVLSIDGLGFDATDIDTIVITCSSNLFTAGTLNRNNAAKTATQSYSYVGSGKQGPLDPVQFNAYIIEGGTYYAISAPVTLNLTVTNPPSDFTCSNPAAINPSQSATLNPSVSLDAGFLGAYEFSYEILSGGDLLTSATGGSSTGASKALTAKPATTGGTVSIRVTFTITDGYFSGYTLTKNVTLTINATAAPVFSYPDYNLQLSPSAGSPVVYNLTTNRNQANTSVYNGTFTYSYELISNSGLVSGTDYALSGSNLTVYDTSKTKAGGIITVKVTGDVNSGYWQGHSVERELTFTILPKAKTPANINVVSNGNASLSNANVMPFTFEDVNFISSSDTFTVSYSFASPTTLFDIENGVVYARYPNAVDNGSANVLAVITMTSGKYAGIQLSPVQFTVYYNGITVTSTTLTPGSAVQISGWVKHNGAALSSGSAYLVEFINPEHAQYFDIYQNYSAIAAIAPKININTSGSNLTKLNDKDIAISITAVSADGVKTYFGQANLTVASKRPTASVTYTIDGMKRALNTSVSITVGQTLSFEVLLRDEGFNLTAVSLTNASGGQLSGGSTVNGVSSAVFTASAATSVSARISIVVDGNIYVESTLSIVISAQQGSSGVIISPATYYSGDTAEIPIDFSQSIDYFRANQTQLRVTGINTSIISAVYLRYSYSNTSNGKIDQSYNEMLSVSGGSISHYIEPNVLSYQYNPTNVRLRFTFIGTADTINNMTVAFNTVRIGSSNVNLSGPFNLTVLAAFSGSDFELLANKDYASFGSSISFNAVIKPNANHSLLGIQSVSYSVISSPGTYSLSGGTLTASVEGTYTVRATIYTQNSKSTTVNKSVYFYNPNRSIMLNGGTVLSISKDSNYTVSLFPNVPALATQPKFYVSYNGAAYKEVTGSVNAASTGTMSIRAEYVITFNSISFTITTNTTVSVTDLPPLNITSGDTSTSFNAGESRTFVLSAANVSSYSFVPPTTGNITGSNGSYTYKAAATAAGYTEVLTFSAQLSSGSTIYAYLTVIVLPAAHGASFNTATEGTVSVSGTAAYNITNIGYSNTYFNSVVNNSTSISYTLNAAAVGQNLVMTVEFTSTGYPGITFSEQISITAPAQPTTTITASNGVISATGYSITALVGTLNTQYFADSQIGGGTFSYWLKYDASERGLPLQFEAVYNGGGVYNGQVFILSYTLTGDSAPEYGYTVNATNGTITIDAGIEIISAKESDTDYVTISSTDATSVTYLLKQFDRNNLTITLTLKADSGVYSKYEHILSVPISSPSITGFEFTATDKDGVAVDYNRVFAAGEERTFDFSIANFTVSTLSAQILYSGRGSLNGLTYIADYTAAGYSVTIEFSALVTSGVYAGLTYARTVEFTVNSYAQAPAYNVDNNAGTVTVTTPNLVITAFEIEAGKESLFTFASASGSVFTYTLDKTATGTVAVTLTAIYIAGPQAGLYTTITATVTPPAFSQTTNNDISVLGQITNNRTGISITGATVKVGSYLDSVFVNNGVISYTVKDAAINQSLNDTVTVTYTVTDGVYMGQTFTADITLTNVVPNVVLSYSVSNGIVSNTNVNIAVPVTVSYNQFVRFADENKLVLKQGVAGQTYTVTYTAALTGVYAGITLESVITGTADSEPVVQLVNDADNKTLGVTNSAAFGSITYSYTVVSGTPGLTINADGTYTFTSVESFTVVFTARAVGTGFYEDYVYQSSVTYNYIKPVLSFITDVLPSTVYGSSYSEAITADCSLGGTITYSLTGGSLPAGLSLTSDGVISGTAEEAGSFEFTVTAASTLSGSVNKQFTIVVAQKALTNELQDVSGTYTYDGTAKTPAATVSGGLTLGTDYATSWTDNLYAGTATLIITGTGNYTGSLSKTFTIQKRSISVTADSASKTYGDADPALTYSITSGSLIGDDALGGALTRQAGENSGSYSILIGTLNNDNYDISFVGANLTINKAAITKPDITSSDFTYDNSDKSPVIAQDAAYTISGTVSARAAGTYTVIISLNDTRNYKWSDDTTVPVVRTWKINKATVSSVTFPTAVPITYGAALSSSSLTGGNADGAFAWADGSIIPTVSNAGYAVIFTPIDTDNFDYSFVAGWNAIAGTVTRTVSITVGKQSVTVAAPDAYASTLVYGDSLPAITGATTGGTYRLVAGQILTVDNSAYSWEFIADDTDNYDYISISGTMSLIVNPKDLTVTADDVTVTYGQAPVYTVTYDGFVNGENETKLGGTLDYNVSGTTISPTGLTSTNYSIQYVDGTLTVTPAQLEEAWFNSVQGTFTYDNLEKTPAVPLAENEGDPTLGKDTDYTVTYSNNINAGTATVIITGIGNYEGTVIRNFTINKATVTKPSVSNNNALYTGSPIDSGIASNSAYTLTGNVTATNAGVYTVIATLNDSANYEWIDAPQNTTAPVVLEWTILPATPDLKEAATIDSASGTITANAGYEIAEIEDYSSHFASVDLISGSLTFILKSSAANKTVFITLSINISDTNSPYYGTNPHTQTFTFVAPPISTSVDGGDFTNSGNALTYSGSYEVVGASGDAKISSISVEAGGDISYELRESAFGNQVTITVTLRLTDGIYAGSTFTYDYSFAAPDAPDGGNLVTVGGQDTEAAGVLAVAAGYQVNIAKTMAHTNNSYLTDISDNGSGGYDYTLDLSAAGKTFDVTFIVESGASAAPMRILFAEEGTPVYRFEVTITITAPAAPLLNIAIHDDQAPVTSNLSAGASRRFVLSAETDLEEKRAQILNGLGSINELTYFSENTSTYQVAIEFSARITSGVYSGSTITKTVAFLVEVRQAGVLEVTFFDGDLQIYLNGYNPTTSAGNKFNTPNTRPDKLGYTFEGWYTSQSFREEDIYEWDTLAQNNLILYAKFVPATYTIEYVINYITDDPAPAGITFNIESLTVDLQTGLIRAGHKFNGWAIADGATQGVTEIDDIIAFLKQDGLVIGTDNKITLYAVWTELFTVTFDTDDGGTVAPVEGIEYNASLGSKMPENPTKSGYAFDKWIVSGTDADFNAGTPVTGNITVKACWIAVYQIVFDLNEKDIGNQVLPQITKEVDSDEVFTIADLEDIEGFKFLGWKLSLSGEFIEFSDITIEDLLDLLDENDVEPDEMNIITVYAIWGQKNSIVFNINYEPGEDDANESKTLSGAIATDEIEWHEYTPKQRVGYDFIGWSLTTDGAAIETQSITAIGDLVALEGFNYVLYAIWNCPNYMTVNGKTTIITENTPDDENVDIEYMVLNINLEEDDILKFYVNSVLLEFELDGAFGVDSKIKEITVLFTGEYNIYIKHLIIDGWQIFIYNVVDLEVGSYYLIGQIDGYVYWQPIEALKFEYHNAGEVKLLNVFLKADSEIQIVKITGGNRNYWTFEWINNFKDIPTNIGQQNKDNFIVGADGTYDIYYEYGDSNPGIWIENSKNYEYAQ